MSTQLYVANRVREIRKKLGLRQEDLARDVGVSRQTIIALERGREVNPSVQTALQLARALHEPVDFLFYLVPAPRTAPEPALSDTASAHRATTEPTPALQQSEEPFQVLPSTLEEDAQRPSPPELSGAPDSAREADEGERGDPGRTQQSRGQGQGFWDFDGP